MKCFLYLEDEVGHTYYGGDAYGIAKFDTLIPEHVKISHVSMMKSHGFKQVLIKACTDDVINAIKQEKMLAIFHLGRFQLVEAFQNRSLI